jgi:hypothetical protein
MDYIYWIVMGESWSAMSYGQSSTSYERISLAVQILDGLNVGMNNLNFEWENIGESSIQLGYIEDLKTHILYRYI